MATITRAINDLGARVGVSWMPYQLDAFEYASTLAPEQARVCLYYRTGAGKSLTALGCMAVWGVSEVLVIAPPATHPQWVAAGARCGIKVTPISHAKFRQKTYKVSRNQAVIADEVHLFGGHGGLGWKKLDTLARHLQAPLVLASATPNYNDAERVYCIQHVLDPKSLQGGYLAFLYANCQTQQNAWSATPTVLGFLHHADAAEYLASLPGVLYLPDTAQYQIKDIDFYQAMPDDLEQFGYDARRHRMIASQIEDRHIRVSYALLDDTGRIRQEVYDILSDLIGDATTPVLVFANHATVARGLGVSLSEHSVRHDVVTGVTSVKKKATAVAQFVEGDLDVLVGTSSLATGTDGLDKVCDHLVILDDTEDNALRRQLIGRILPRGADADTSKKRVYRLQLV